MAIDLTCKCTYGDQGKVESLTIDFGQQMKMAETRELADLLEMTAIGWANCKGCVNDQCDKHSGGAAPSVH